jgi:hypothetical protein
MIFSRFSFFVIRCLVVDFLEWISYMFFVLYFFVIATKK